MRKYFLAAVCVLAGAPAFGEAVDLGDDTLKQTVTGKTVNLDTPFGVAIPITYHSNGLMSGKAGVLEYFLGAQVDRGRWWIANGKLCQKWFKWLDAEPSCMHLKQDGARIFWRRDDGMNGTATIAHTLPLGAEGLGGPIETPQIGQSLSSNERPETAVKASIVSFPATVRQAPKAAPPRAAVVVAPPAPQLLREALVAEPRSDTAPMAPEQLAAAELGGHWCRAAVSLDAGSDAEPLLVVMARLSFAGSELPSPANACLEAEPPLQHLARMGFDPH